MSLEPPSKLAKIRDILLITAAGIYIFKHVIMFILFLLFLLFGFGSNTSELPYQNMGL